MVFGVGRQCMMMGFNYTPAELQVGADELGQRGSALHCLPKFGRRALKQPVKLSGKQGDQVFCLGAVAVVLRQIRDEVAPRLQRAEL